MFRVHRVRGFAVCAFLLVATSAFASSYTSTQSGDWNQTSTWGGAGVPGSGDDVTITSSHVVTVTDARVALTVTLDSTAGNKMLVIDSTGSLLVESAPGPAVAINAPSPGSTNIVRINGGTLETSGVGVGISITGGTTASKLEFTSTGGTATFAGDVVFNGTAANARIDFGPTGGVVEIGGDLGNGGTLVHNTNDVIAFNGSGAQTINGYAFSHLQINKAGGTATLNGSISVDGDLVMNQGVLDDGGYAIALNGSSTSNVTLTGTSVLKLGSAASATAFPSPYSAATLGPNTTVVYQAGVPQTINGNVTYSNLYLSTLGGSVTKTVSTALLQVNDSLDIWDNGPNTVTLDLAASALDLGLDLNGNGTVSMTTGSMTIGGDFSSSASLVAGTGQVTYDGTIAQSMLAATYNNLVVNKTSGTATLGGPTTVNNLTVSSGTLDFGTNTVTLIGDLWVNGSAALSSSTATLQLNGTATQTLTGGSMTLTFGTLTVNNTAGASIAGIDVNINNALNLAGGRVDASGNFFVDVLATVTRTSGWINGDLTMGMNATPARRFHIGSANAYLPVDADAASAGTLTIRANEGKSPDRTANNVLDRYWTIASGAVTSLDSLTFNWNASDVTTGTESQYILASYDSGTFTFTHYGAVNPTTHTVSATNVTTYVGDWIVGQPGSLAAASQLAITTINGGSDPSDNTPFSVVVEAQDDAGNATAVFDPTVLQVSIVTGTGTLGGTTTGTINSGSDTTTITGVTYTPAQNGVQLGVARTSGDLLANGTSASFNVLAAPSTITVTSLADSGAGTLRDAITSANNNSCSSPCTIDFSVSGEINLSTALPAITADNLTIDGYTSPGSSANTNAYGVPSNAVLTMAINGGGTVNVGFDIQATFVKITGFAIKYFGNSGVVFSGDNSGSNVSGCYIGTDVTGSIGAPNAAGVHFSGSTESTLGGMSPADRNVISGNSTWGVITDAAANSVSILGNYIGTKADLSGALGNNTGVKVCDGCSVSLGASGVGNVISGNIASGLVLAGDGTTVVSSYIGTAGSGNTAIPNATGIQIDSTASFLTIGGSSPSDKNVISGNTLNGILLRGDDNTIENNLIGIAPDGTTARGNGGSGISIESTASRNFIGTSSGNKIANNVNDGITHIGGIGNVIRLGKITNNTHRAIDLSDDGSTANDATDSDTGPNNLQNFPVIAEAKYNAGNVDVKLSLDSSGGINVNFVKFDVYKADGAIPPQAIEYLGNSGCLAGNVFANLLFSVPAGSAAVGNNIVATATSYSDAGCTTPSEGTSELSAAARIGGDVHWIAGTGNWELASNWNPAVVPTSSDNAYIDNGGTYTVSVNSIVNIASIHIGGPSGTQTVNVGPSQAINLTSGASSVASNGILTINGNGIGASGGALTVSGTFNWNVGSITGAGGITLASGATMNIDTASGKALNAGSLTIGSGATANWLNGPINVLNAGFIDNFGTFDVKTDNSISDAGSAGTFDNAGTFRKTTTAGSTTFSNLVFNHTGGTVDLQTGTLNLAGGTASAPVTISSGASMLIDSDTFGLATGSGVTGAGKIQIAGGTLNVSGTSVTIEHLQLDNGTLTGTGIATTGTTGGWQWNGGTMSGSGTSQIESGATLVIGTASAKSLSSRTLSTQAGSTTTVNGSGTLNLSTGGKITNAGLFDTTTDVTISDAGTDGGFTNSGTLRKSGGAGSTSLVNVDILNNGTIDVQTGTFNPGNITNTGAIQLATGTLLVDDGIVDLNSGSNVSGAGLLRIAGGTLTHNENTDTLPNVQLDSGTLNGVSSFDITTLVWNGGTMSGAGTTNIPNLGTAAIATASGKSLQRTFVVNSGGTTTVTGSGSINLSGGGNFFNQGLFDFATDVTVNDAGGDGGFDNSATLRKSAGAGSVTFSNVDLLSSGTLEVQSGTFNPVLMTSTGTINLSASTFLLVDDGTVTLNATNDVTGAGLVHINGGTLTANANDTIPNLKLDNGTLNGAASLTITNLLWNGGTMSGAGSTIVPGGATAAIATASAKSLQRTFTIQSGGTTNVTGSGTINFANGGNIANDGTIDVSASVTFNDAGLGGDIANTRTFRTNAATTLANVTLNSSTGAGLIDVVNGALDLADGTNSAAIQIGSTGSLLINSDTYTLATGTTVTGTGTLNMTGGTLNVTGNVSVPQLTQNAGTIDGSGTLTLSNTATWSNGTMLGGGTTTVGSGAFLTLSGPSAKLLNNRTLSTVAGGTINLTGNDSINLANGANIANAGTILITADSTISDGGLGGNVVNTGTIRKQTATAATSLSGIGLQNNGGLIDIQSGSIGVVSDTFTQTAGSTLKIWLNGTTPGTGHGQLWSTTTVNLAGTLEIALVGPYQPNGGNTFRVINAPAVLGDFTHPYTYPALAAGRTFSDAIDSSGLLLTVNGNADLSISKSAPANVATSAPIAYTLTVNNAGPDVASSVSVTDTLPAGHTSITASGTGWTCNVVSLTVTCTAATLTTGTAPSITINATAPSTAQTFINTATVSSSNDANGANNSGTATVTVDPMQAELQISSSAPAMPVAPSSPFTFTFSIKNNGPSTATNVIMNAPIPSTLNYSSAVPAAGSCNYAGNTVSCTLGSIASGVTLNVAINLTAGSTAGTHMVSANVFSSESDPSPTNNDSNAFIAVTGSTITVTTTIDGGPGSLREALDDAGSGVCTPLPCLIDFNIPGPGPHTIQPLGPLPSVANQTTVDATTQPGYTNAPLVRIDGQSTLAYGLHVSGDFNVIRGLSFTSSIDGLKIDGNDNVVEASYIGLDPTGAAAPNVDGFRIAGNNNVIGGTTAAQRNVISGNSAVGVYVDLNATNTAIRGNYIGTDAAGTSARPNVSGIGVIDQASNTTIGGSTAADRNLISGNSSYGIYVEGTSSGIVTNTVIRNNWIGTDAGGTTPLPNGTAGIAVENNLNNTLIKDNVISGNQSGIAVTGSQGTQITSNSIYANTLLGIDIDLDGVTPNDSSDADIGPNGRQNFPTLGVAVLTGGGNVSVTSSIDSSSSTSPAGSIRLEFFKADASGEGQTFVGSACISGNSFATTTSFNAPSVTVGTQLVATATSFTDASCSSVADGTSEFSNVVTAANCTPPPVTITGPTQTCAGSSVILDAGAGFAAYSWSTGANTRTITVAPTSTQNYSVTVTDNLGCTNTDAHTVNVNPLPSVTITGPTSMCAGGNVTLDAGLGFTNYAWSNGATTQTITVSPASTQSYSVTVTDGNGCQATDAHNVTVNPNPSVNITGPTSICAGGSVTLDAGSGFASYLWSNGATSQTITVSPGSTQSYSVTVSNGSCSATDAHNVTVTTNPTVPITATSAVCQSSAGNSASVAPQAGATYNWTIGNGTITAGQGTNAITYTAGPTGSVSLGITMTVASCTSTGSTNVPIVAPPVVNITGPTSACAGTNVTLDAGSGFASYLWSTGATTQTIVVAVNATQTYSVTVSNAPGCSTTDNHTVTMTPAPSAVIDTESPVPPNQSGLTASVAVQPGATYAWSITNGTITAGNGTDTITFKSGASGITHLHVTVTLGGCSTSFTQAVFIEGSTEPTQADLAVTKSAPATVQPGGAIAYTIGLRNFGPGAASNVVLTDTLPAGTTFVTINPGPWNCTRNGATITCTGNAAAGTNSTITIVANAPQQSGIVTNVATITSATPDPNAANNSASASTNVTAPTAECPATPPSLLLPVDGASLVSPVQFSWTAVSGATEYELWINNALETVTAATSATRPLPSGTFPWFVVARFSNGCDPLASATRTVTVQQSNDCSTSTAPQLRTPANGSTVSSPATFMWTAVAQAIGYRVWFEANGTAAQDAGTTNATSLSVALPPGAIVAYVDALFAGCPPARSAPVQLTVPKPDPCATRNTAQPLSPANDAVVNSSSIEFAWSEAAGADGYRIWASIDGAAPAMLGETADTSLKTTIGRGTIVWFVETLHDGCASTESQTRRFTIPERNECPDQKPATLSPANNSSTNTASVQFAWSSVPNAVSYELWASADNGTFVLFGKTTTTSLVRAVPAGRIDWFVRAIVDRCGARDSQKSRFTFTPPDSCLANDRPVLASPLGGASIVSPARFDWSNVNATKYEVFVTRGNAAPQLVATTTATEATGIDLAPGKVRWFVRAHFGDTCGALDSAERRLEIVSASASCAPLAAPAITAPGQVTTGVPFLIQWTPVNGATAYQVLVADNANFTGAAISTVTAPELPFQGANGGNEPIVRYLRVRAINAKCQPATISPYGPTHVLFILPKTGAVGSALLGTNTLAMAVELGPQYAGQSFTATPKQPWLTVTPSSGVVPAAGMQLTVVADASALPAGTSIGGISVSFGSGAGSIATNDGGIALPIGVSLVTPVSPVPSNTPPPDALIIPAIAHADGINSHFQSDVRVSNTSAEVVTYQLTYTPSGDSGMTQGQQTTFTIEPGRTIALDDILKSWFATGTGGAIGTLEIRPLTQLATSTQGTAFTGLANLATFASSRTFNMTSNGTFGQYIPAIPFANFIGSQRILSLQQIAQSPRYRTNLGIVEGSGEPASLLIRMFGEGGQSIGQFPLDLNGGQHIQLNSFLRDHGVDDLTDGRVEIEVTSEGGKVTAYASVLDNQTSDPLLVTPVEVNGAGATKWVVPGVADLASGFANWQTDMRVFNAGTTDTDATLTFYSQNGGEPRTLNANIPAGRVLQADKALSSLFGITNDGGAVHITTSEPARLIATARTYNQTSGGTYGQFISAVTPNDAAGAGDRPLQLLQVEETDRFRSNVGIVEVTGNPVRLEITAVPPDTKFTAVTELFLNGNEFRQLGSLLRSMGLADTHNARVTVRVIDGTGRITAYASVIDMLTNDPTYVPAQ